MNIVIVGFGKFGRKICENLTKENHNVVVIDNEEELVQTAVNNFDVMGYCGNGASIQSFQEAGVAKFDVLVAVTPSDELNILSCLVAKKLKIRKTIARIRNPEYVNLAKVMGDDLGVDLAINPDLETANKIAALLQFPSALKVDTFADGKVDLVEIKIEKDSLLVNQSLFDIFSKFQVKILVGAVRRNDEIIIPKGNFVFQEGDYAYIASSNKEINYTFKKLHIFAPKLKSTMIIGGGKISNYLTGLLVENGIKVKVIDNNAEVCSMLSEKYPTASIINGDGTNQNLLIEEGLDEIDSFITLTGFDETNIIVSTFAKNRGCEKVVCKVNNSGYDPVLKAVGLDSTITPHEIFANYVIRYVRGMQGEHGSDFKTLYRLVNGKVEALEFYISEKNKYTSIPLLDLHIKHDYLICSIIRNNEVIIPGGKDTIEQGDSVVIVTSNTQVKTIEDIFD